MLNNVKDEIRNIIAGEDKIMERWREYVEELLESGDLIKSKLITEDINMLNIQEAQETRHKQKRKMQKHEKHQAMTA